MNRETVRFDVVIVGAGPAGLSAAIRLAQLNRQHRKDVSICVLEKGAEVGAHCLSGAVFDPRALNTLIPDWRERGAPVVTPVTDDRLSLLTRRHAWRLPVLRPLQNEGNYIISLGELCRWLARQAEDLGVTLLPGFAAADFVEEAGRVIGVRTGDKGVDRHGRPTARFQAGVDVLAPYTLIAEGCRGSLAGRVIARFRLRDGVQPPTYALGIKELWEMPPSQGGTGGVLHTVGWPLDARTYGGGFLYRFAPHRVAVGLIVGLDYENPYLDPFEAMQLFKTHPAIRPLLRGGKRVEYGARALYEGGLPSLPKLVFPGGVLLGDAAGFLNAAKLKGTHTAMQSGLIAAEAVFDALGGDRPDVLTQYPERLRDAWVWQELHRARNIRPAFRGGLAAGLTYAALDIALFHGRAPWTFQRHTTDRHRLRPARACKKIFYPKPDNVVTFDKLSSVYLSNTRHEEDQPCHLHLKDPRVAIDVNLALYDAPETRYCPAGVYEIVTHDTTPRLQINAANCVHCKACDIKDPTDNIVWTVPEGGDGPRYRAL